MEKKNMTRKLEEIERDFHERYNNVIGQFQREEIVHYFHEAFKSGKYENVMAYDDRNKAKSLQAFAIRSVVEEFDKALNEYDIGWETGDRKRVLDELESIAAIVVNGLTMNLSIQALTPTKTDKQ